MQPGRFDAFAVAVLKDNTIVGHIPGEITKICWYFLHAGKGLVPYMYIYLHREDGLCRESLSLNSSLLVAT